MVATSLTPQPFEPGFRLIDGSALNDRFAVPQLATANGLVAKIGGGQVNAVQITTPIARFQTVTSANDSAQLPPALPGLTVVVDNDGGNTLALFPNGSDQIEDSAAAISIPNGEDATFVCPALGKWYQIGGSGTFSGTFTGTFDGVVGGTTPAAGAFTSINSTQGVTLISNLQRTLSSFTSTTGSTLPNDGVAILGSTDTTAYTLPDPVAGCEIEIIKGGNSTQVTQVTPTNSSATYIISTAQSSGSTGSSAGYHSIKFTGPGQSIRLRGVSTNAYAIVGAQYSGSTIGPLTT